MHSFLSYFMRPLQYHNFLEDQEVVQLRLPVSINVNTLAWSVLRLTMADTCKTSD